MSAEEEWHRNRQLFVSLCRNLISASAAFPRAAERRPSLHSAVAGQEHAHFANCDRLFSLLPLFGSVCSAVSSDGERNIQQITLGHADLEGW